jgi:serine/threonine-protein kinase
MLNSGVILQGRYRILRQLGGGGMGTVYLAEDTRLSHSTCAIKELSPDNLAAHERNAAVQAFQQETQILAKLHHPGITAVTDFFAEGRCWYLVMEYVPGVTLEEHLALRGGRLQLEEALAVIEQLCAVLDYLHRQTPPVIFRDLKPSNVIYMPHGQVKLIDFGIARFFKPGQTRDTMLLGTPGYAAPELYGNMGQSGPCTDVYGLGALLLQLLTGFDPTQMAPPFPLPALGSVVPGLPVTVEQAVLRATQLQPHARFTSVREFWLALADAKSLPTPVRAPRRASWYAIGTGAVLMLCILLVTVGARVWKSFTSASQTSTPLAQTSSPLPGVTVQPLAQSTVLLPTVTPVLRSTSTPVSQLETPGIWEEPGADSRIAFVRVQEDTNRNGRLDWDDRRVIYLMNADGSDERPLTANMSGDAYSPSWSPDGSKLVFTARLQDRWQLYTMEVEYGTIAALDTGPGDARGPTWSPSGTRIAYYSDRAGNDDIYVFSFLNGSVMRLTFDTAGERYPVWSPDERRLAYQSELNNTLYVSVMDADGSNATNLTQHTENNYWPSWSPDGQKLAFVCERYTPVSICILDLNTGYETRLTHFNTHAASPNWAGDGAWIAFARWENGESCEIYRMRSDGTEVQRLTYGNYLNTRPNWSP